MLRGLERLEQSRATCALVLAHKGPVRIIAEKLLGTPLEDGEPALAGAVGVSLGADGVWRRGRRSSDPEALEPEREARPS